MDPPLTLSGWLRYDIVERRLRKLPIRTILEIGPGIGAFGVRLARRYDYVGVEIDQSSAEIAAQNLGVDRGRIVNGSPEDLTEVFDAVCAFEVLEHIDDDFGALRRWRERVQAGGWLILSVPAWESRWGGHDVRAGHFRRYEPDGLRSLLEAASFEQVSVLSYGFPLLSALHPLWNALSERASKEETYEARTRASGRFRQPPRLLAPATMIVSAPFRLAQRPFVGSRRGTGLIAFAQKTGTDSG
jgi:SAM-dependent methyltransferase